MQHVKLYTDNLLFLYGDLVHLDKYTRILMAQMLFSQIQ